MNKITETILLNVPAPVEILLRAGQAFLPKITFSRSFPAAPQKKLSSEDFESILQRMNIKKGDLLMVHSDSSLLAKLGWDASEVITFLLEYLGPQGTLAMPTHPRLKRLDGKWIYDPLKSPSTVGLLTEIFRRHPGVIRSLSPFSSVAAYGPLASALLESHDHSLRPHDEFSPYAKLGEFAGKVLSMGVGIDRMTILHVAEDTLSESPVKNFYEKKLVWVRTPDGKLTAKTMNVRAPWLWWYWAKFEWNHDVAKTSLVKSEILNEVPMYSVEASALINWMIKENKRGRSFYPLARYNRFLNLDNPFDFLENGGENVAGDSHV